MSDSEDAYGDNGDEGVEFTYPNDMHRLRACVTCNLIKTEKQFIQAGCDNCKMYVTRNYGFVDYTTPNFEGLIAITDPKTSWISRHLNLSSCVRGTYALKVRSKAVEGMDRGYGRREDE